MKFPSVRRGYDPRNNRDFSGEGLATIGRSAEEYYFLLNRGYSVASASTFVGNHHQLSERQRIALMRVVSPKMETAVRRSRQVSPGTLAGKTVHIDGFNQIITLEVAQSGSPVLLCMDGTFRDLAGLRGTYRLIDKTQTAISLILSELQKLHVSQAVFWLDRPVSNSGRLGALIIKTAQEVQMEAQVEMVDNVDWALYWKPNVISNDSVVLNRCNNWFNLCERVVPQIPGVWIVACNWQF